MRNDPGEHTFSGAFLRLSVIPKNKEPSPVLKQKRPSKRRVYKKLKNKRKILIKDQTQYRTSVFNTPAVRNARNISTLDMPAKETIALPITTKPIFFEIFIIINRFGIRTHHLISIIFNSIFVLGASFFNFSDRNGLLITMLFSNRIGSLQHVNDPLLL